MTVLLVEERLPFRGGTVAQLELTEWRNLPVGRTQQQLAARGELPLWEGQLGVDVPKKKMKSKRAFPGRLIQPEHVRTPEQIGDAVREARLRRDLWQLWFMPGGGRDICRTSFNDAGEATVRRDVPWLFPDCLGSAGEVAAASSARGDRAKGAKAINTRGRWTRARLSAAFTRVVRRHAAALAINLSALEEVKGALGFHTIRRLFGSYWAPRNLLVCSRLLDHTDVRLTAEIYCGQDVRSMTLDLVA